MSPMRSFLEPAGILRFFGNLIPYVKFNKVSSVRLNVCAHSLAGIFCEKDKMH